MSTVRTDSSRLDQLARRRKSKIFHSRIRALEKFSITCRGHTAVCIHIYKTSCNDQLLRVIHYIHYTYMHTVIAGKPVWLTFDSGIKRKISEERQNRNPIEMCSIILCEWYFKNDIQYSKNRQLRYLYKSLERSIDKCLTVIDGTYVYIVYWQMTILRWVSVQFLVFSNWDHLIIITLKNLINLSFFLSLSYYNFNVVRFNSFDINLNKFVYTGYVSSYNVKKNRQRV